MSIPTLAPHARRGLLAVATVLLALAGTGLVQAQSTFPNKAVRMVVPFAPGGATDLTARIVAEEMTKALGQTVVVDNKPGANNQIGVEALLAAPPDGYTMMIATTSTALLPQTNKAFTIDMTREFAPITWVVSQPTIFAASAQAPFKTMAEFLAYTRRNPGKVNYGAGGAGDLLAGEYLKVAAGIDTVSVRYKSGNEVAQALLKNEIQYMIAFPGFLKPFIDAGQARALALTSKERHNSMPGLPSVAEFGGGMADYEYLGWSGLVTSSKVAPALVDKLYQAAVAAMKAPGAKAGLAKLGFDVVASTPAEFGKLYFGEMAKWKKVADGAGIKPE